MRDLGRSSATRPFAARILGALAMVLAVGFAAGAEDSVLEKTVDFDVAAQELGDAVLEISRQSGTQVIVASELVEGRTARAVRGRMTIRDALGQLLEGTGLDAAGRGPNTISIISAPQVPEAAVVAPPPAEASVPAALRPERSVEEIIVTATRRAENVQYAVGCIRVLDGAALEAAGVASMEDYIFQIPGIDITSSGLERRIAIRGISNTSPNSGIGAGAAASPIGLYLNDVPIQGNGVLPDLALYDLSRIEVLKGPQGTLYGEGAQGGAIRMLLSPAVPDELSARGDFGVGATDTGSGLNESQNVAANAPLYGPWAALIVGSRRIDQGYVDFPNRGTRGEDDAENLMGRLHLDGRLFDDLSVSGLVFHQRQRLDQFPTGQLDQGDLRNANLEPQFSDTDFTLLGLTLEYDLGFAQLTSATSWFRNERQALNRTPLVSAIAFILLNPALGGGFDQDSLRLIEQEWIETSNVQRAIAQEFRLVSRDGEWLDWIAGFFYRRRTNDFDVLTDNDLLDLPPPAGPGVVAFIGEETFEQFALYGETILKLPWQLELTGGLRAFREDVGLVGEGFLRGPLYPVALLAGRPSGSAGEQSFDITTTAFTPKVSLSWFPDDLRMFFAQVSSGVRSGGTNTNALSSTVTPLFEPDELWAYEVGAKTQWLDSLLTLNVSAFYNDWQDLQVGTIEAAEIGPVPLSLAATLNVSSAFTRGVEVEIMALPVEALTAGFNLLVGDGRIVEGDPAGYIPDDTPVPQLAELSYSAFLQYAPNSWSLFGFTPSVSFDTQRTGSRLAFPPVAGVAPELDGFQLFNALVGFSREWLEVSFGVRNLTDARNQLGANIFETKTLTFGRPRTWSVRLAMSF